MWCPRAAGKGWSAKSDFDIRGVSSRTRLAGCIADALQDVDQVGVGVHAVQPAGDQQFLDDTHPAGADRNLSTTLRQRRLGFTEQAVGS